MDNKCISIILGGGQGSRLYPLTASRSKPAVPIAGKYRLVDIPISNCLNSGILRMFVLTQFNSASLNKHIKYTYNFSIFSQAFVDVLAAEQTPGNQGWFQGTADAVRQSLHHFVQYESDYVLILSGDQLYHMDFEAMIGEHIKTGAEISIATLPVNAKDATSFGILKTNPENWIEAFIEKPVASVLPDWKSDVSSDMKDKGKEYLASMGIYIFNKQLLVDLLTDTQAVDFGKEIIPQSISKHKVLSYQYNGYWTDIGNIDSFFEANLDLTRVLPQFNLFDNHNQIFTRPRILPPSKIARTRFVDSIVAEGCVIGAESLESSIVGVRSRIGYGSVLKRCYIMGANRFETLESMEESRVKGIPIVGIGENCYLENCVIDKNARIGDRVKITGGKHLEDKETDTYVIKEGIVVIRNSAIIASGTEI